MVFGLGKRGAASVVGLDLGSHSIKVAEMDHSGRQPTLINYGITELVPGAIVAGQVEDRQAVLDALNVLFDTCQIAGRQVNIALAGADVIIKTIQTERMNQEELSKAISWEAEQNVPFPLNEISMDYQVLDPESSDPQMNVLLVAAKRTLIEERLELLDEAGMDVLVLDVDTFCLLNALEANYDTGSGGCHCIVHFGNQSTHLSLVRNGLPILTRNLPVGGSKLVDLIQGQLGLSEEEAYMALYGPPGGEGEEATAGEDAPAEGEPAPRRQDIGPFVESFLDDISIGVNRAVAFLESTEESGSISSIYLSGGCANIPGMDRLFEDKVGIATMVANPLNSLDYKRELFQAEPVEDVAATLTLAIGLGLRAPE